MPNCHFCSEKRGLGVVVREQNLKTTSKLCSGIEDLVTSENIRVGFQCAKFG